MKEVKFRAWDYSKKIFLPTKTYAVLSVTEFGATGIMLTDFQEYREGEYFYPHSQVISQYTGLKDNNGTEIYSGDVLKNTYGKTEVVVFKENGWYGERTKNGHSIYNILSNNYLENKVIIGNIFENPELL